MPTNIDNVQDYTGNIALRSNASTFPQDAEDQYTYLAELSQDLNVTVNQMNTAISETNDNAISAEESKDAAKASEDAAAISAAEAFDSEQAAANSASSSSSSASSSLSSAIASATSAIESSGFADSSEISAQQSAISATEAKTYRDQASEISGLDTVTEAVDLALSESYQYAMTKAEFFANAEQRKRESAGSGFLEWGKHNSSTSYGSINEGMWQDTSGSWLRIGNNGSEQGGTSRTPEAISLVNGVAHRLSRVANSNYVDMRFPDAEQGTRSYDSATGEVIDYLTDVDPKYGDVAADLNEAVARNFEGLVKNGDFRSGLSNWNAAGGATLSVSDGVLTVVDTDGVAASQATSDTYGGIAAGTNLIIKGEFRTIDGTAQVLWETGGSSNNITVSTTNTEWTPFELNWTQLAGDEAKSWSVRLRESGAEAGESSQFRNISMRKVTSQPILSRQDFCFLETFHEVVSDKGVVLPLGNVQYGATTYEGIPLQASNTLQGYSAFGEWDSTTTGYSAVWANLTTVQQKAFLDDPDNNLYFDAEANELIQVRYRVRIARGAGDVSAWAAYLPWTLANSSNVPAWLQRAGSTISNTIIDLLARGSDDRLNIPYANARLFGGQARPTFDFTDKFVWQATNDSSNIAHNGLCFALPICLVQR